MSDKYGGGRNLPTGKGHRPFLVAIFNSQTRTKHRPTHLLGTTRRGVPVHHNPDKDDVAADEDEADVPRTQDDEAEDQGDRT